MLITGFYAALLSFFFVLLSLRTIFARRRLKISMGDNGNPEMLRHMRVHSNFSEYVPLGLLLLFFLETSFYPASILHGLGMLLLLGRLCHVYGTGREKQLIKWRIFGMILTFAMMIIASLFLLLSWILA